VAGEQQRVAESSVVRSEGADSPFDLLISIPAQRGME
jgi:hypothetical protein